MLSTKLAEICVYAGFLGLGDEREPSLMGRGAYKSKIWVDYKMAATMHPSFVDPGRDKMGYLDPGPERRGSSHISPESLMIQSQLSCKASGRAGACQLNMPMESLS